MVGYPICDGDGKPVDHGLALVPLADLEIHDSWYMSGLAATASDTVSGKDVFVPEHRILPLSQLVSYRYATEHTEETLFRSTFAPTGTLMLAPVIVGLAQAALEATRRQIGDGRKRVASTFLQDTRQAPTTQLSLAEASVKIDAAYLQMCAAADAIDAAAKTAKVMAPESRAFQRTRLASAIQSARGAVDLLLDIGGAGSFALANPVQRMWRDLNVGSRHGFLHAENNRAIYGRALVGAAETTTPLT